MFMIAWELSKLENLNLTCRSLLGCDSPKEKLVKEFKFHIFGMEGERSIAIFSP